MASSIAIDRRPVCSFFGRCKKGKFCELAHWPEEETYNRPLCRYTCFKGSKCRFKHVYPLQPRPDPLPVQITEPLPAKIKEPRPNFLCKICNLSCISQKQLEEHCLGKKHKKKVEESTVVKRVETLLSTFESLDLKTTDRQKVVKEVPIDDIIDINSPNSSVSNSPGISPSNSLAVAAKAKTSSPKKSPKNKKKTLNLYCGNCGSKQQWDWGTDEEKDLTAKRDEKGNFMRSKVSTGVTQGCIRFTGRSKSKCTVCYKQIMRSSKSAVCVHCNALLGPDWTPYNWSCTNVDGTSAKRFLPPPENKEDHSGSSDTKAKEYLKPCGVLLHSAIAGKLVNVDGRVPEEAYVKGSGDCYGFVMVH